MSIITIILFLIYTYGIGFTASAFLKNSDNFLERNLMRFGIGLGIIPLIIILLSWLKIPLDWKILLLISLVVPVFYLFKNYKKNNLNLNFKLNKSNLYILIVLLLFALTFFMYHKGAFAYPWMEDDDSWTHAYGAKYVSIEKTVFEPIPGKNSFQYMDAYPPSYDALIGILHQTSPSMMWTIKFFNALIVSLSILFFYFFAKEFTGSKEKALFSTFILAMIPCFLSHFIWAPALITPLIFPFFYSLEKIKSDKNWVYVSSILFSCFFLIHLTHAIKITVLLLIYILVRILIERKFLKYELTVFFVGLAIALLVWWGPMLLKYQGDFLSVGLSQQDGLKVEGKNYIGRMGSAGRTYYFGDFFYAKTQNMINNPIGVGAVLCTLLMLSFVYLLFNYKSLLRKENSWKLITLLWLIFTFLGIHGGSRIPIAFWSFRFWMLFAIPVSIIVAEGMWFLMAFFKGFKINKYIILSLVIIGLILTSGYQKYAVNTAMWGPGGWLGPIQGETEGFLWLKQLPVDTKVFVFSNMGQFVIGFDKFSCEWCPEVYNFRKNILNSTPQEINSWLNNNGYEYALVDAYYIQDYGANETNKQINEIASSGLFQLAYQTQSVIVLKVA